jgi:hypothetical protein
VGIFQYQLPEFGDLTPYLGGPFDLTPYLKHYHHAFFPKNRFDEHIEVGNWNIGRKGDAYVALFSEVDTRWSDTVVYELYADTSENVWIVELGDVENNGSFANFVAGIINSVVLVAGDSVYYDSPSQGAVEVGWTGPMTVGGDQVDLGPYPRWDNPYCYQEFGTRHTVIRFNGEALILAFLTPRRLVTTYMSSP